MKEPCSRIIRYISETILVSPYSTNVTYGAYRITSHPEGGNSAVSRKGGSCKLIEDCGASVTELYGKGPSPEPRTQNLCP